MFDISITIDPENVDSYYYKGKSSENLLNRHCSWKAKLILGRNKNV